jgi:hypothetical protein
MIRIFAMHQPLRLIYGHNTSLDFRSIELSFRCYSRPLYSVILFQ